jgi:hypothetical protein
MVNKDLDESIELFCEILYPRISEDVAGVYKNPVQITINTIENILLCIFVIKVIKNQFFV